MVLARGAPAGSFRCITLSSASARCSLSVRRLDERDTSLTGQDGKGAELMTPRYSLVTVPPATPSDLYARVAARSCRPLHQPNSGLISLDAGEPDFDTPPHIIEAMTAALQAGVTHYPHGAGDPELREALAHRVSALAGISWRADQIYITHGASGGCGAALMAFVNPGDKVLLPDPTYSLHADQIIAAGAFPTFFRLRTDFHLDLEALEAAAAGARMLLLTNPTNPTGVAYRRDELEAAGDIAKRHNLLVLSDEVYHNHVFDDHVYTSALQVPNLRERLIYAQTFGKLYAMTGWRIGYLAGSTDVIAACRDVHRTLAGSVNSAVQRAALAALDTSVEVLAAMRDEYRGRRDLVQDMLSGIPGVSMKLPEAGFYTFVRVPDGVSSNEVLKAAAGAGVAVRSGAEYGPGGEGHIRVSYCVPRAQLVEGLVRLRRVLEAL